MPQHLLALKVGAIIMLLRNLNRSQGLFNGTMLRVLKMFTNFIEAEILIYFAAGNKVFQTYHFRPNLPFKLKWTQIPIRLAYTMTIEISQGQSFEKVDEFLPEPFFSHGQLYVAFARARSFDDIKVSIIEGETQGSSGKKLYIRNVVYPRVLNIENCDSSRPEFITYMICPGFGLVICEKTCPGFGLSFGFHGVHPYQKNICSHPPPPPSIHV